MIGPIRRLEKKLVRERTEIGVALAVDEFLRIWDLVRDRECGLPDPTVLFRIIVDDGFYLPATYQAMQYIERRQRTGSMPDRDRLLRLLLPTGARLIPPEDLPHNPRRPNSTPVLLVSSLTPSP